MKYGISISNWVLISFLRLLCHRCYTGAILWKPLRCCNALKQTKFLHLRSVL